MVRCPLDDCAGQEVAAIDWCVRKLPRRWRARKPDEAMKIKHTELLLASHDKLIRALESIRDSHTDKHIFVGSINEEIQTARRVRIEIDRPTKETTT